MPQPDTTLLDIEKSVHSPHVEGAEPPKDDAAELDSARNAVMEAISQAGLDPNHPEPRADAGAPILGMPSQDVQGAAPAMPALNGIDPSAPQDGQSQDHENQLPPPPPIPPPMMPGSFPPA
jgi:hypothetical protein